MQVLVRRVKHWELLPTLVCDGFQSSPSLLTPTSRVPNRPSGLQSFGARHRRPV